jgi:CBS domain-containing protein
LKELIEPVPQPLLQPTLTAREVSKAFVEHGHEFFYVSSDGETLEGVVTITDLLRAQSSRDAKTPVLKDLMTKDPVVVSVDDDCALAANAIREYRLKSLPVVDRKGSRKLVGCLRVRRLMAFVLQQNSTEKQLVGTR